MPLQRIMQSETQRKKMNAKEGPAFPQSAKMLSLLICTSTLQSNILICFFRCRRGKRLAGTRKEKTSQYNY